MKYTRKFTVRVYEETKEALPTAEDIRIVLNECQQFNILEVKNTEDED